MTQPVEKVIQFNSPLFVRVQTKALPDEEGDEFKNSRNLMAFIVPNNWDYKVSNGRLVHEVHPCYDPEYFYLALLVPNKPLKLSVIPRETSRATFRERPFDEDGVVHIGDNFPIIFVNKTADFTLTKIADDYTKLFF